MGKVGDASAITTDLEMTQYLDQVLDEAIAAYQAPDGTGEEMSAPGTPSRKWRYSSAYQKAVRRNDASIKSVAAALNRCDPSYIWRRAPTIALEDVSLGDPWVCAIVLHACRFARLKARYGPDRLAGFVGSLMGSAVKDRLSCDSFCLAYLDPRLLCERSQVAKMSIDERAELYRSDAAPTPLRVAAGIGLAGPRYGGSVLPCVDGSPDQLAEVVEELAPYPIQWISRQYSRNARDGMFVSLPLVWRGLISEGLCEVAVRDLPERRMIDGVLSATFDGHTQEGRRSIAYFSKACAPVEKFLAGFADKQKILALAVFTVDSSLLDRYLMSPWAKALYEDTLRGEALAAGVPPDQFSELTRIVVQNRDKLNLARSILAK